MSKHTATKHRQASKRARSPSLPKARPGVGYKVCDHCDGPIAPRATFAAATLRIDAYVDVAEVFLEDRVVVLKGQAGRVLSELVACGGEVGWEIFATEVFNSPAGYSPVLRLRMDMALTRLRRRLAAEGVPTMVVMNGSGLIVLDVPGVYSGLLR